MPCVRRSLRTVSDGCAPRASQSRMRSSLSTIVDGFVWALYCPTVSITRPSRLERWSATTTRQIGFLRPPTRVSLSLTAITSAEVSVPARHSPRGGQMRWSSSGVAHERTEVGHLALGHRAHDLAHLLKLLDQLLDGLHVGARAARDP